MTWELDVPVVDARHRAGHEVGRLSPPLTKPTKGNSETDCSIGKHVRFMVYIYAIVRVHGCPFADIYSGNLSYVIFYRGFQDPINSYCNVHIMTGSVKKIATSTLSKFTCSQSEADIEVLL